MDNIIQIERLRCAKICGESRLFHDLILSAPTPQNGQTQTIRQQQLTYCLNVFDHFVGLALKGLINNCRGKSALCVFSSIFIYFFRSNQFTFCCCCCCWVKQCENLKKKLKDVNTCFFSTISFEICGNQKFQVLKAALALTNEAV